MNTDYCNLIDLAQDDDGPADIEELKSEITRLAGLPYIDYQLVRRSIAKDFNIPPSVLDKLVAEERADDAEDGGPPSLALEQPEPWPDAVDGMALLAEIAGTLRHFIAADRRALDAAALWCVFAHAHNCFSISPILAITSPSPGCGKSTFLSLIAAMVPKALGASNITAAALFRSVEKWQPTLILDEGDTFIYGNDELRGVMNSGHLRASAFVVRTTGDDHEPRQFRTWCPKSIALIGNLPATLADRSIHIKLQRSTVAEAREPLRIDRLDLSTILRKAARWAADNADRLKAADPDLPNQLHGRAADNWRPLISIADAAGSEWPQRARQAALALAGGDEGQSRGIELLADIKAIMARRGVDRITSGDMAEALADLEGRPWPEWRQGRPISANGVARLLRPFGIQPTMWRKDGRAGLRGYRIADLKDAFNRYLTISTATTATPLKRKGNSGYPTATKKESVAVEKRENINKNNPVAVVAVGIPGQGYILQDEDEFPIFSDDESAIDDLGGSL